MDISKEMIEKAKKLKSVEELMAFAKDNNIPLTDEEAQQIFAELNREGELAQEELDNVAGGTCYSKGTYGPNGYQKYAIVTALNFCYGFYPQPGSTLEHCSTCTHSFTQGPTMYCAIRTKDNDPHKD